MNFMFEVDCLLADCRALWTAEKVGCSVVDRRRGVCLNVVCPIQSGA
jgi:hypothetical protein